VKKKKGPWGGIGDKQNVPSIWKKQKKQRKFVPEKSKKAGLPSGTEPATSNDFKKGTIWKWESPNSTNNSLGKRK